MYTIQNLAHTERRLANGAEILVLNTGALIGPEADAMLQALHSRSIGGIRSHLKVLAERGPEKFMSTFYVGYGHKSIGDCGTCTIFIENVSMLCAKAIQDNPLYSGQEASTRYIDFAKQRFIDPVGSTESSAHLEKLRAFYLRGIQLLPSELKTRYPRQPEEKEAVYEKAINARAFDIMRAFLPAGAATNLAWHTNLRQAADHLARLRHHPLKEVRDVANGIEDALCIAFPNSFTKKRYDAAEAYAAEWIRSSYWYGSADASDTVVMHDAMDHELLKRYGAVMSRRPARSELPKFLAQCGTTRHEFLLDFGSYRDLQRQRAVSQRMPLLTTAHGIHSWYLDNLPEVMRLEATRLMFGGNSEETSGSVEHMLGDVSQYYTPMGYRVPCSVSGDLPALVYLAELRSQQTVHATLRLIAQQMARLLEQSFGRYGLTVFADHEPTRFDIKRGTHDIVRRD